jgi:hypothetical protein
VLQQPDPAAAHDDLDVEQLIGVIWHRKWWIAAWTVLLTGLAVADALLATEWYRAEVVLMPRDSSSGVGLAGQLIQFVGLAGLAGLSLGQNLKQEPIGVLRSKGFARRFIEKNDLVEVLAEDSPVRVLHSDQPEREVGKERERQQIQVLTGRLLQDQSTLALRASQAGGAAASQASETPAVGQSLLRDLQSAESVGPLVINLERIMAAEPGSGDDVVLRGGDRLRVPKQPREATVIGEVQNATSHLYDPEHTREDDLRLSAGTTKKADDKRIYVVRANGSVEAGTGSRWFRQIGNIQPGDTIIVPLYVERMRSLPMWQAVTLILFNLAVAVAAVNSF